MSAFAGLRGTGDWGTDERPKNFRESIMFYNPAGDAPFTALLAKAASKGVNDPEFSWWSEPKDIFRLQVDGAIDNVTTTLVVDSADPTPGAPGVAWGTALNLKKGDHLLVEPATPSAANMATAEVIEVAAVASATTFTIVRGAQGTTPAAIADDVYLLKIGSSYAEGEDAVESASRNPLKYNNLTQIFRDAYDVTRTASKTYARTGNAVKNDKVRKAWDHSIGLEWAFLFGRKNETTGANGKPKRSTAGVYRFMPTSNINWLAASVTYVEFMEALKPMFDFSTGAGDQRICLCGNQFLIELQKMALQTGTLQWSPKVRYLSMDMRSLEFPFGEIFFKRHPLLSRNPMLTDAGFILDFSAIQYRHIDDTKSYDLEHKKQGRDKVGGEWLTEAGLMVDYGGLTQGFIGNFAATVA